MVCSKFCLEKTIFQLHSKRKEAGDWILCHSQSAVIQQFFLALAFYFLSFALKDFKGLIQRLWRCIKTQGPDRILPVSPIKQNSDMAKFLGLLGFNREEHALEGGERQWGAGLQESPYSWALYSPFPFSYQGIQISFSKPFHLPYPFTGLIHKNWLNIVVIALF